MTLPLVGAGPAGISAGLEAQKQNLSYLVLDQQGFGGTILQYPRKKVVMTRPIEIPMYGWLDRLEYTKEELLDIWNDIHARFHLNLKIGERLTAIEPHNRNFYVKT